MLNNSYYKGLDGLRAMSMLMIMFHHAGLAEFTWVSVQLFFVLSGFLITGILWKEKNVELPLSSKFKKFWIRRSLRILPLYFIYVFLFSLSYVIIGFPKYLKVFSPYLITYTVNFTRLLSDWQENPLFIHLWTLSIEEQFYLIFPIIILLTPKKYVKYVLLSLIIFSPVARYFIGEFYKGEKISDLLTSIVVNYNTLSHMDAFCIGGIIQVLSLNKVIKKPVFIFWIAGLILIITGYLNFQTSGSTLNFWEDLGYNHELIGNYEHVWHYTLIDLFWGSLILVVTSIHQQNRLKKLRRFLDSKIMVNIGKVSYGMYIFHWLILTYLFYNVFKPDSYYEKIALFIPYTITVYVISRISFKYFEEPIMRLKDKFYPPRDINITPITDLNKNQTLRNI